MKTIDLTPTWAECVGIILTLLESGNHECRTTAIGELKKMAQAADLYNASKKKAL